MKKRFTPKRLGHILTLVRNSTQFVCVGKLGAMTWEIYEIDSKPLLFRTHTNACVARNCSKHARSIKISEMYY